MQKNYYMIGLLIKEEINMEHPNAKKHQTISFIKSWIRIIGYFFIPFSLVTATLILVASEIVGIIEELV